MFIHHQYKYSYVRSLVDVGVWCLVFGGTYRTSSAVVDFLAPKTWAIVLLCDDRVQVIDEKACIVCARFVAMQQYALYADLPHTHTTITQAVTFSELPSRNSRFDCLNARSFLSRFSFSRPTTYHGALNCQRLYTRYHVIIFPLNWSKSHLTLPSPPLSNFGRVCYVSQRPPSGRWSLTGRRPRTSTSASRTRTR